MSTEWTEETIREHMFTEVEFSYNAGAPWIKGKLTGFDEDDSSLRFKGENCEMYPSMRLIPKPKKRLMKPIELAGKWLDFGDEGMSLICGFMGDSIETSQGSFEVEAMNCHRDGCIGWRDTPTSELNIGFEVDE